MPAPSTIDLRPPKQKHTPASRTFQVVQDAVSAVTRAAVSLEYASLRYKKHCPLGIYIVPSLESILVWDAVLFVHQGLECPS